MGAQAQGAPVPAPGPSFPGGGLRLGLEGRPPREPVPPTEPSQVSIALLNLTPGALETWWANLSANPSNRLGLQPHVGWRCRWQAPRPSCLGSGRRRAQALRSRRWMEPPRERGLPEAPCTSRLPGSEGISRCGRPCAWAMWLHTGSRGPRRPLGGLRDPGPGSAWSLKP